LTGSPIRQEYLEAAIDWMSKGAIDAYMADHQHEKDAKPLWGYFQKVIEWTKNVFPDYRREMKNVAWGPLYNEFKDKKLDAKKLAKEVAKLMEDDEVGKKSGIYPYLLTTDDRYLNLRAFSDKEKREAFERQKGKCAKCGKKFDINEMEGDHVNPWSKGGKTIAANCQMLCKDDNRRKSGI
jgi:hypothetical protein